VGQGADIHAVDEDGNSVLLRAVSSSRDRDDIAHFLLEKGARPAQRGASLSPVAEKVSMRQRQ